MMTPSAMVFLLAASGGVIDAARIHLNRSGDDACPDEVSENSRGDCVDARQKVLPHKCCEEMRSCHAEVGRLSEAYLHGFMQYVLNCSIAEQHIGKTEEGYKVVNSSAICSDACQAKAKSFDSEMPGYEHIDEACRRFETPETETMKQRYGMTVLLRDALATCTTGEQQPRYTFIKTAVLGAAAALGGATLFNTLWAPATTTMTTTAAPCTGMCKVLHVPSDLHEFVAQNFADWKRFFHSDDARLWLD